MKVLLVAEGAGRVADRIGRRPVLLTGYAVYVLALTSLAFTVSVSQRWLLSLVLGLHFGLTEGAERALVRELAPIAERGTAFGWFYMIVGLAAIPAGLLLGGLWALWGAKAAPRLSGDHHDGNIVLLVARTDIVQTPAAKAQRTQSFSLNYLCVLCAFAAGFFFQTT